MNDVKATQVANKNPHPVASAAPSTEVASTEVKGVKDLPSGGSDLPAKDIQKELESLKESQKPNIEQAVTEINEYVQSVQRDLHFSVDEDSGLTVIRVRDKESGELIRQIPEDIFLSLAQNLKENQTINLLDAQV